MVFWIILLVGPTPTQPTQQDYFVIPEVRYSFTDALWGAVGANIFGGEKKTTFFGQLDKNDNVYITARYEF
jgi:hypothetical protein